MPLIWLTGVPASGKSTVCRELVRRGLTAYDADEDGFRERRDRATGEPWFPIVRERVQELRRAGGDLVILAGSVPNEGEVWDLFDGVICLVVDDATLTHRLATRTGRDFGKTPAVRDAVLSWNATSAADYLRLGATLVDATRSVDVVVDRVLAAGAERLVNGGHISPPQ